MLSSLQGLHSSQLALSASREAIRSMTPSERIHLIRKISEALAQESWSAIDLTLRQFQLPCSETWHSNREHYVIEMVDSACDEVLLELAQHLMIALPSGCEAEPVFWAKNRLRLFISHTSASQQVANDLAQCLDGYAMTSFIAYKSIQPTKEWRDELELALFTTDVLIALITSDFHQSIWTNQEIGLAVGRKIPIIPIKYGSCPDGIIEKYQALEGDSKETQMIAREVFSILAGKERVTKQLMNCLVSHFCDSRSFAEAKRNMALIEEFFMPNGSFQVTDSMAEKLKDALNSNNQIKEAYTIPARVSKLLQANIN